MSKIIIIAVIILVILIGSFVFRSESVEEVGEEGFLIHEESCSQSGGIVAFTMCCGSTNDFPNLCLVGSCGCSPENSHEIKICDCGEGKCFDGEKCVESAFEERIALDKDPLNTTYIIEGQLIELKNGYSEKEIAPGSATKIKTTVWGELISGDLNTDGLDDTALIFVYDPGGSGTFYYVAASLRDEDGVNYSGTNAVFLGDRISVENIFIKEGIIEVIYKDRAKDESMTTPPSIEITKNFAVRGITLEEVRE